MKKIFMKLTNHCGEETYVNIDNICIISKRESGITTISFGNMYFDFKESIEYIINKIKEVNGNI